MKGKYEIILLIETVTQEYFWYKIQ